MISWTSLPLLKKEQRITGPLSSNTAVTRKAWKTTAQQQITLTINYVNNQNQLYWPRMHTHMRKLPPLCTYTEMDIQLRTKQNKG